jgi:glycosyltransferase involved in cell wall biosynthesis
MIAPVRRPAGPVAAGTPAAEEGGIRRPANRERSGGSELRGVTRQVQAVGATNDKGRFAHVRIAMIGQKGIPARYGGVEKAVEELAARLVQRGHHVTAFNKREPGEPQPTEHRGIELRYVPAVGGKHMRNMTQSLFGTVATLTHRYDIVHYHALGPCLTAPLARLRRSSRIVNTIQGRDDQRAKWSRPAQLVLSSAAWMSANVPHGGIAVSQQLQREFREQFGKETVWIPNGVAVVAERPVTPEEDPLVRFGLEPGRYLINVGRLVPEKAIDQLLRAWRSVETDIRLAIVGGSSHTDDFVERLGRLAQQDDRIVLTGPVYGAGQDRLFRHAAGYVMPSLLEGLPLALLEAISYGLPVTVSDIAPHLEVVGCSEPGQRVFRAGDLNDMAKQLQLMVDDLPGERDAAQLLHDRVVDEFSWERVTDKTEEFYESLLAHRAGSRARRTPARMR